MYTRNQLIIAGLLVAGASALVTYMYMKGNETAISFLGKPPRKIIHTTSGEPISYATGKKRPCVVINNPAILKLTEDWYVCTDENGDRYLSDHPCNSSGGKPSPTT